MVQLNRRVITKKNIDKKFGQKSESNLELVKSEAKPGKKEQAKENDYSWLKVGYYSLLTETGKKYPSIGGRINQLKSEKGKLRYVLIKVAFSELADFKVNDVISCELTKIKKKYVFKINQQAHFKIERKPESELKELKKVI